MAALGVRSASVPFARPTEAAVNRTFQRTAANGRERSPVLAMQKVVGSSPIIRSRKAPEIGALRHRQRLLTLL
jgi:hypothetical protein